MAEQIVPITRHLGPYRKAYTVFWRDEKVLQLPPLAKLTAAYLMWGPQTNRIGLYYFSIHTGGEDLKMTTSQFTRLFTSTTARMCWKWDQSVRVMYIPTWWKWNEPDNPNQLAYSLRDLASVPTCPYKEDFVVHSAQVLGKRFAHIFENLMAGCSVILRLRIPDSVKEIVKQRDGDQCRYCRRQISWLDRKSSSAATYDHIDPRGDASPSNVVVACKSCNSSKGLRTPEQAGMPLSCSEQFRTKSTLQYSDTGEQKQTQKQIPPPTPPAGGMGVSERNALFEQFYQAYPKKRSRGQAERAFARLKPDAQTVAKMLAAIERFRGSPDWSKEGGRYVPYPATWLNAKCWEDELGTDSTGNREIAEKVQNGGTDYGAALRAKMQTVRSG